MAHVVFSDVILAQVNLKHSSDVHLTPKKQVKYSAHTVQYKTNWNKLKHASIIRPVLKSSCLLFGQHLETAFKMAAGENVNLNQVAPKLDIGLNDLWLLLWDSHGEHGQCGVWVYFPHAPLYPQVIVTSSFLKAGWSFLSCRFPFLASTLFSSPFCNSFQEENINPIANPINSCYYRSFTKLCSYNLASAAVHAIPFACHSDFPLCIGTLSSPLLWCARVLTYLSRVPAVLASNICGCLFNTPTTKVSQVLIHGSCCASVPAVGLWLPSLSNHQPQKGKTKKLWRIEHA